MAQTRWSRLGRPLGFALGAALVLGAVIYALREVDWRTLRSVEPVAVAAIALLVLMNLLVTAGLLRSITRQFPISRPVGMGLMTSLVSLSAALNYLPLPRLGLVGRTAYLKGWHGLSIRDSTLITLMVLGLALLVLGPIGIIALLAKGTAWGAAVGAVFVTAGAGLQVVAARVSGRWAHPAGLWVALRGLDLAAAAGRIAIAFAALGQPLSVREAVTLACASLLIRLAGLTPNGLGLSEWVVAALSAAITPIDASLAAAAALLDRAVDVGVTALAGLLAGWRLSRAQPDSR